MIGRRIAAALVWGFAILDKPFAQVGTGTKTILGYVGIATLLVAVGTWIAGSFLAPG